MAKGSSRREGVQVISFACYGTLIDAESGILRSLEEEGLLESMKRPVAEFLQRRQQKELEWQKQPYRHYREILVLSLLEAARELEIKLDEPTALRVAGSMTSWEPFEGTASALRRLGSCWPLGLLSNAERFSLRRAIDRLGIPFAEVVSAEDVRSYKPETPHFEEVRRRWGDRAPGHVHVASSVFHDILPAASRGIATIWLDHRKESLPDGITPRFVARNLDEVCQHLGV